MCPPSVLNETGPIAVRPESTLTAGFAGIRYSACRAAKAAAKCGIRHVLGPLEELATSHGEVVHVLFPPKLWYVRIERKSCTIYSGRPNYWRELVNGSE